MFVMLYICKRKVKLYSIYTARKRRSRRFSFFCFRARLLFLQMPCSDSLFLSFLPIATCNAPHCSWQSPPLVVAIRPIARGFGGKARYLFKKLGRDLKSLGSYSEKSARLSKNVVVAPSKAGGKWGTARKR